MSNLRFVNGDPNVGKDDLHMCPKGGRWGESATCPWLTIQFGVNQLAKLGGGTLMVAPGQYKENVVMAGKSYSDISIIGDVHGALTAPGNAGKPPTDAEFCEPRPLLTPRDPAKPVVTLSDTERIRLEDLHISKGNNRGIAASRVNRLNVVRCCLTENRAISDAGGGFLIIHSDQVLVRECRIIGNKAQDPKDGMGGGGALIDCPNAAVQECRFSANVAGLAGGALRVQGSLPAEKIPGVKATALTSIDANTFGADDPKLLKAGASSLQANKADYGGAISINDCDYVRIGTSRANQFLGNEALKGGGAIGIELGNCLVGQDLFQDNKAGDSGGALYLHNKFNVVINGADFYRNQATNEDGGAIYAKDDGVYQGAPPQNPPASTLSVALVTLRENKAPDGLGGGICSLFNVEVSAQHCRIVDNEAGKGGGLCHNGGKQRRMVDVDGTLLDNNRAVNGGGICVEDAAASIADGRFSRNQAMQRGGGLLVSEDGDSSGPLTLARCLLWQNRAAEGAAAFIEKTIAGSIKSNRIFANQSGFHFYRDALRTLGVSGNWFLNNLKPGQDIVSVGDASKPTAITRADLAAANAVKASDVTVK